MGYMIDSVDDKTSIITVEGGVDEKLEEVARRVLTTDKTPNIILDLEQSRPLLGDHIELAVKIHHLCTDHHGVLKLCHLARETQYVMEIMNLDQFFYIFPTLKAALETEIEVEGTEETSITDTKEEVSEEAPVHIEIEEENVSELEEIELSPSSPERAKPVKLETRAKAEPAQDLAPDLARTLPKKLGRGRPIRRVLPQKNENDLTQKEREERVEQFVHYVAKTMTHLKVFEFLVKHPEIKQFTLETIAPQLGETPESIQHVIEHLHKLRIIDLQSDSIFRYAPGPKAVNDILEFLRMWNHPKNHSKILAWVLAEEKVYLEAQKKLEAEQQKQKPAAWKRWFSKETPANTAPKKVQDSLLDEDEDEEDVDSILSKAEAKIENQKTPSEAGFMTLDLGGDGETIEEENLDPEILLQNYPKTPEYIPKYMNRVTLHLKHENLDKAVNDLSVVIDLQPSHIKARLKRGEIFEKQEKFKLAVQDYSYILQREPRNYTAIKNRSECFYRLLSYDQSIRDCNTLISASMFKFDAFSTRGKCQQNMGKYVEAIQDLTQALKLKPHWAKGLVYRGKSWQAVKKYKEALSDFEQAYKLNPKYGELKKLIAEVSKKV